MKLKVGSWYYFKKLDHAKDMVKGDELILEICGKVEKVSKTHVHLIYWNVISSLGDSDSEDKNHERASIPICTIIKKKKLNI